MRLVIVDNEGVITTVTDNIEDFDLDKAMARANVIEDIKDVLESIKGQEESREI